MNEIVTTYVDTYLDIVSFVFNKNLLKKRRIIILYAFYNYDISLPNCSIRDVMFSSLDSPIDHFFIRKDVIYDDHESFILLVKFIRQIASMTDLNKIKKEITNIFSALLHNAKKLTHDELFSHKKAVKKLLKWARVIKVDNIEDFINIAIINSLQCAWKLLNITRLNVYRQKNLVKKYITFYNDILDKYCTILGIQSFAHNYEYNNVMRLLNSKNGELKIKIIDFAYIIYNEIQRIVDCIKDNELVRPGDYNGIILYNDNIQDIVTYDPKYKRPADRPIKNIKNLRVINRDYNIVYYTQFKGNCWFKASLHLLYTIFAELGLFDTCDYILSKKLVYGKDNDFRTIGTILVYHILSYMYKISSKRSLAKQKKDPSDYAVISVYIPYMYISISGRKFNLDTIYKYLKQYMLNYYYHPPKSMLFTFVILDEFKLLQNKCNSACNLAALNVKIKNEPILPYKWVNVIRNKHNTHSFQEVLMSTNDWATTKYSQYVLFLIDIDNEADPSNYKVPINKILTLNGRSYEPIAILIKTDLRDGAYNHIYAIMKHNNDWHTYNYVFEKIPIKDGAYLEIDYEKLTANQAALQKEALSADKRSYIEKCIRDNTLEKCNSVETGARVVLYKEIAAPPPPPDHIQATLEKYGGAVINGYKNYIIILVICIILIILLVYFYKSITSPTPITTIYKK